ncbi:hypothetical protein [Bacillus toyonensis]|uniref:hypothetical protein n=1 Tax=Bacillus toyonensis TaxID=155322 RepID=UPI000BFEA294|nr:hypothetical protein [Bacillus toyonensis]PHG57737.1 hypothetical protein COI59_29140 [Bacillus toyonensis]
MNRDPILKNVMKKWAKMSQDTVIRKPYEARQKAFIDEVSKYKYAEKREREKGIEDIVEFTSMDMLEIRNILEQ